MNKILKEIKELQNELGQLTFKFGDYGLDQFDAEQAVEALEKSIRINRVLLMELKDTEDDDSIIVGDYYNENQKRNNKAINTYYAGYNLND